jgi:hypothetical protein
MVKSRREYKIPRAVYITVMFKNGKLNEQDFQEGSPENHISE